MPRIYCMSYSFIKIPRTGTNSVCESLGLIKDHWSYRKAQKSDFTFAFFRHPADRLVSWWEYHTRFQPHWKMYQVVFSQWIIDGCPTHHTTSITDVANPIMQYQFINEEVKLYDFQKMAEVWPEICERIGVDVPLRHSMNSIRRPWEEYYNQDIYKLAKDLLSVDWKIYGKINPSFTEYSHLHFA